MRQNCGADAGTQPLTVHDSLIRERTPPELNTDNGRFVEAWAGSWRRGPVRGGVGRQNACAGTMPISVMNKSRLSEQECAACRCAAGSAACRRTAGRVRSDTDGPTRSNQHATTRHNTSHVTRASVRAHATRHEKRASSQARHCSSHSRQRERCTRVSSAAALASAATVSSKQ